MNRHHLLIILIVFSAVVTTILFVAEDSPDKRYLNPAYLDVLVLFAGGFLVVDAFKHIDKKRFFSNAIRVTIGGSIITLHTLQFLFDFIRYY